MEPRIVTSLPGLSHDEALVSLQEHEDFVPGTKIASLRPMGNRWIARLEEPITKKAEDDDSDDSLDLEPDKEVEAPKPPFDSDGSDDSDDSDDSDSDSSDKPKPPKKGEPSDKKDKGGDLKEVLNLLRDIAEALGVSPGLDEGAGPLPPSPKGPKPLDGPPGGPPGLPGGGPEPAKKPTKLGPGEVPGGVTPPGAPAFSKVKAAMREAIQEQKVGSFVASTEEAISIKNAKKELEATFPGYQVRQAKRVEGSLRALLVRE